MSYTVLLTAEAQQDLDRLFDFVLERELALGVGDLQGAQAALDAITEGLQLLRELAQAR